MPDQGARVVLRLHSAFLARHIVPAKAPGRGF
jgi:hypothetical protein